MTTRRESLFGDTGALFSPCRSWRYRLWRTWDHAFPRVLFVLMNPSTADEVANDPTIERCVRRVMRWPASRQRADGAYEPNLFGSVEVVNVFAWRETDSRKLPALRAAGTDIVGPDNDAHIVAAAQDAALVVCGWGKPGNLNDRGRQVLALLQATGKWVRALGINADGTPQHPLYIGYDAPLVPVDHVCSRCGARDPWTVNPPGGYGRSGMWACTKCLAGPWRDLVERLLEAYAPEAATMLRRELAEFPKDSKEFTKTSREDGVSR